MSKSIKRLVVTGAAVMVMMSFAAPAMARPYYSNPEFVDVINNNPAIVN